MRRKKEEKPLTLTDLAHYTQKTLLPAIEKRLENFPTKEYLEERLENFPTKEYLEERLENFATKKDWNKMMNKLDKTLKNQEDQRQENTMQASQNRRVNDRLEAHARRIQKLELKRLKLLK